MTNDQIIRTWFDELWNKKNEAVIDQLADPEVMAHGLKDALGNEVRGLDDFKRFYQVFASSFPDHNIEVEFTISEKDMVAALVHVKATHRGDQLGYIHTDREVEFDGIVINRIRNGKITDSWNMFDLMSMYQQLGMVSMAPPNAPAG
jgi:steroid delta-isomerase-like uncharacterized protein